MSLIDFILNLAGLLLWLNWRAASLPPRTQPATTLLSTLRPAGPPETSVYHWIGLPILLLGRAIFYWQAGPPAHWSPHLALGPTTLSFRSDMFGRMFLFSLVSFAAALWVCYLWLFTLSCVNTKMGDGDPAQRLVRAWLGRLERWPTFLKLLLPLAASALGWWMICLLLLQMRIVPVNSSGRWLAQGAVIGLSGYLTLKFLIVSLLLLYLVNSYVYLGEFPFWNFVNATARALLRPLRWLPLRVGRIDLAPLVAILIVIGVAELARRGLVRLYFQLL